MFDHKKYQAQALAMKAEAEGVEVAKLRCIEGEKVWYVEGPYAVAPGHIYTHNKGKTFRPGQMCEFHFDLYDLPWPDRGEARRILQEYKETEEYRNHG
jgi:hypothetical protein